MALPIPRIVWPITITAGENDLLVIYGTGFATAVGGLVGTVAAGSYLTPEALLAAVVAAAEAAEDAAGVALGDDTAVTATLTSAGVASVAFGNMPSSESVTVYWSAPPAWVTATAYDAGDIVSTPAGRIYLCTTAGTSGATAPTGETATEADGAGALVWAYKGRTVAAQGLAATLGFTVANDGPTAESGFTVTFTADVQIPNLWTPDSAARFAEHEREFEAIVTQVETGGGQSKTTRWTPAAIGGRRKYGKMRFEWLEPKKVFEADATGADLNQAFETFWTSSGVGKFRWSPDRSSPATGAADLVVRASSLASFKPERASDAVERFHFEIEVMRYLDASGNESP